MNSARQRGSLNKELLFMIAIAAFVVAAIVGMMLIDDYGQRQMGGGVATETD